MVSSFASEKLHAAISNKKVPSRRAAMLNTKLLFLLATFSSVSSAFFGSEKRRRNHPWGQGGRRLSSSGLFTTRDDAIQQVVILRGGQDSVVADTDKTRQENKDSTESSSNETENKEPAIQIELRETQSTFNQTVLLTTKSPIPAWKANLPPLLQNKGNRTLQRLLMGNVEIFLLGTAHVSNDSCHDVKLLLESVHPDCIFVELCEARIPLLDGGESAEAAVPQEEKENINATKLSWGQRIAHIQESQGGSKWQAICTLLLTSVQEDYANTLGVELGGEFQAAHEYWKAQRLRKLQQQQMYYSATKSYFPVLILGDRPLSLTLVRAWESLTWWPKIKVMMGLLWSSFSKPKPDEIRAWLESVLQEESDVLTESLAELRQHFPSLHTTIIEERDAWLACKLVQTSRILRGPRRATIVAIVGAGHIPGIVQMLTTNNHNQTAEGMLMDLCQTKRWQNDDIIQKEILPQWVNDVTQVQDPLLA